MEIHRSFGQWSGQRSVHLWALQTYAKFNDLCSCVITRVEEWKIPQDLVTKQGLYYWVGKQIEDSRVSVNTTTPHHFQPRTLNSNKYELKKNYL